MLFFLSASIFSQSNNSISPKYIIVKSNFDFLKQEDRYKTSSFTKFLFNKAGFNKTNSEFCYLDNRDKNAYDGYSGLNKAIHISKGQYIILIHQDVRLEFDNINDLRQKIQEIQAKDHNWAVLGNAGGNNDLGEKFINDDIELKIMLKAKKS